MRLWLPAPTKNKIGSGSGAALEVEAPGGSGSATLLYCVNNKKISGAALHTSDGANEQQLTDARDVIRVRILSQLYS